VARTVRRGIGGGSGQWLLVGYRSDYDNDVHQVLNQPGEDLDDGEQYQD